MRKILSFCLAAMIVGTALPADALQRHKSLFIPKKFAVSRQFDKVSRDKTSASPFVPADSRRKTAPLKKVTAEGSNIYGYLYYTDDYSVEPGFYGLGGETPELVYSDPVRGKFGIAMDNGWFVDGKVCSYYLAVEYDSDFGLFPMAFYYSEIDFATGTILKAKELDIDDGYMQISAYNTSDKCVYGFGYDWMGNFGWLQSAPSAPAEFELVKKITDVSDVCYSLAYNPIDGKFYGITASQKFVSITPEGDYDVISALDSDLYFNDFQCGLVYCASEQKFYWNPQYSDFSTGLSTISLDGAVQEIYNFYDAHQFTYMFTTDEAVAPDVPVTPTVVSSDFGNGTLSGAVVFGLPDKLGNGQSIAGELDCFATLDDAVYSTGKGIPGESYEVEYKNLSTGFHTFGLYVSCNGQNSKAGTITLYVGVDNPAAPANVRLTADEISWSPVTSGANGGYVDLSGLKYEAYLNGELLGSTEETSFAVNIGENEYGIYQATVVAITGELRSEAGISNKIVEGKPMQLPVFLVPTQAEFELMSTIDANGDGRGWSYSTYSGCIQTTFSKNGQPMDDWIFLPAISLESVDKYYTFGMTTNNLGIDFKEEYAEVKAFFGEPDLSAPSIDLIDKFQVSSREENVARFQISVPGTYYIGIHCLSEPDQYGIQVRDIFVRDEQIVAESPVAVTGLTAEAHDNGVLKATVSFTFPTLSYEGNELQPNVEMTAKITAENSVTVTGHPGQCVSAVVETHQGVNTVAVSAYIGENGSPEATVDVYTGVDVPQRITVMSLDVAPDMLSAELTWEAPTLGENGGFVDPSLISYEVYRYSENWYGSGWEKLYDCGTSTSYTFSVPQGSAMEIVRLGVLAINAAGHSESITYRENLLGTPYTLPMVETFEEPETLDFNPWLIYYSDNGVTYGWAALNLIAPDVFPGNTKSALYGRSRIAETKGSIGLPRFSTMDQTSVTLIIDSYSGEYAAPTLVTAQSHGDPNPVTIGELEIGEDEFATATISLPASFLGKEWVQIYLDSEFRNTSEMMLATNIEVKGGQSSISSPSDLKGIQGRVGQIRLLGYSGEEVLVNTPDGRLVRRAKIASDDFTIDMPAGIYIVNAGGDTAKIVVR